MYFKPKFPGFFSFYCGFNFEFNSVLTDRGDSRFKNTNENTIHLA